MTDLREIHRIEELADFRGSWDSLWAETPRASFFQTWAWFEAYWRHFGAGLKLRALLVSDGGRVTGIVPFVVTSETTKVGAVRVLTYPLSSWGSFFGPLGPDPRTTLAAAFRYLRESPRDWDLLEPRWVWPEDGEPERIHEAMTAAGFQAYRTMFDRTAVLDFQGDWDAYLASRSPKRRTHLRRLERKTLARAPECRLVRYRPSGGPGDADPRWDLYDACESIARASWQGHSATGTTLSHEEIRAFLRDAHEAAARLGMLDLNVLYFGDRPAAFAYNYRWGNAVYGLRMGYLPEWTSHEAGTVLLSRMIQDGFHRGDASFDFGVGSLSSKRAWASRLMPIYRFSHFAPGSPRVGLLRVKRWFQQWNRANSCDFG